MERFATMTRWLLVLLVLVSCKGGKNGPDVSGIKVDLRLERFDQAFFRIDTANTYQGLADVRNAYPEFYGIFMNNVLGIPVPGASTGPDGSRSIDPAAETQLRSFLSSYRPLYDSLNKKYPDLNWLREELGSSFRYVKYYYPDYKVPKVLTVMGPINALANLGGTYTPNFIGPDFLGIGMQFYLGKDFSLYQSDRFVSEVAPRYRSIRFDKEYIVPEAMLVVADDIYPNRAAGLSLIEQMIERGKQWWLLDHFLPNTADTLKRGYTGEQLSWVKENEGNIWAYLIKNTDLYGIDPETNQIYLGEGPNTMGLPERSPGNIGQWIGLRIVEAFAEKHEGKDLKEVLATPAKKIFEESRYRPK